MIFCDDFVMEHPDSPMKKKQRTDSAPQELSLPGGYPMSITPQLDPAEEARNQINAALESIQSIKTQGIVEVEVRLGILQDSYNYKREFMGKSFTPGVRKEDFHFLRQMLEADKTKQFSFGKEIDFFVETDKGRVRVTYDGSETQLIRCQKKIKQSDLDLQLPSAQYDCRVGIATEVDVVDTSQVDTSKYEMKREKERWSFTGTNSSYRIDLTRATSSRGPYATKDLDVEPVTYEVEIEFTQATVDRCRKGGSKAVSISLWTYLTTFLQPLQSAACDAAGFEGLSLLKVPRTDLEGMRNFVNSCIPQLNGTDAFPGSMPVNFSRRYIPYIQQNDYYISEKTDGIRYMMIINSEGVFLTDRKFEFYRVEGYESLPPVLGMEGPTVLDGEMVNHLRTNKPMYLAFDILVLNGGSVAEAPLSERLKALHHGVVVPFEAAVLDSQIPQVPPFSIAEKQFFHKKDMKQLFLDNVKQEGNERFYVDAKRHHKTDGIVFTPDVPYQPRTCKELFKWKYMDEWSIDLKIHFKPEPEPLSFSCVDSEGKDVPYPLVLKPDHLARLKNDVAGRKTNIIIVECSFDFWTGEWNYKMIRTDKSKANFIRIVFDTLEAVCENITSQELMYRMAASPGQDDWQHRLHRNVRALVEAKEKKLHAQQHPKPTK